MKDTKQLESTKKSVMNFCENLAKELHTMIEVKDYKEYGFARCAFMTDKFGGCYCAINIDTKGVYDSFCDVFFNSLEELAAHVAKELKETLKARDLDEIADLINAEY